MKAVLAASIRVPRVATTALCLVLVLAGATLAAPTPSPDLPSWLPPAVFDPCPGEHGIPFETASSLDGVKLRGHVHVPEGFAPPFPIVLEVGPYFGTTPGGTVCPPTLGLFVPLREAGFAIAMVSLRGTGESDGCLQFGTSTDVADVGDIIDALAAQAYSDGDVAIVGGSFSAMGVMAGVASRADALRAAVVVSPVVDWWSVHTRGGAQWMPTATTPMPSSLAVASFVPGVGLNVFGVAGLWGPTLPPYVNLPPASHVACPEYAEHAEAHAMLAVGDRTAYWRDRDLRTHLAGATTPVLFVNGLKNFEEMVQQSHGIWTLLAGEKRVVLGNWDHLGTPPGFAGEQVNWIMHHARGVPLEGGVNVTRYQDRDNVWRNATQWPPTGDRVTLKLSGTKLVPASATIIAGEQTFQTFQGNPCLGLCIQPPVNFQPACGPFQALYVSEPVAADAAFAGHFRVSFTLTSDMPDGNLAAFLWASSTGVCPDPGEREMRRAMTTLRHVFVEEGREFPVDAPTAVSIRSLPFASEVRAGERLVLAIGGSAAPIAPRHMQPELTVTTGAGLAGELELTVVEGSLTFASAG